MLVGVLELRLEMLALEPSQLKKAKRRLVRSMLDRVRSRFAISAAEVELMDNPRKAVVGFCAVGSDGGVVNGVLSRVQNAVEEMTLGIAEISEAHYEVLPVSFEHRRP